ncbi:hypothetical protein [Tumidithrix helvetica]|uniref:hypothetical protein n=1 Tax=Tumidithrix helvetica TaxID=3457545 RepID=UPI003CC555B8
MLWIFSEAICDRSIHIYDPDFIAIVTIRPSQFLKISLKLDSTQALQSTILR